MWHIFRSRKDGVFSPCFTTNPPQPHHQKTTFCTPLFAKTPAKTPSTAPRFFSPVTIRKSHVSEFDDTIVAISTPPGRGGIGIIRLSGPAARAIAEPLLRLRHPPPPAPAPLA